jgi:glycosyltransferase involved in cell wall biosynthesis
MSACSIVIRAYNEEEHIGRLLSGILQQTVRDVQIILVDSGSTDATVAIASRYPVDVVSIKPQDFTFGRSLNLGISHAKADYVVIASAHVYPVYPDWLESMLKPFSNPRVALTYGKQRTGQASKFSENQVWQQWYPNQPRPRQKYPFCNNANAAIRRELWEQRSYDETLSGLEDLDWARWSQDQGHEIVYIPEAEVVHVHHETWHGIYNRYRREAMAFKQIYPQEKFDLGDFIRLLFVNVFNDWKAASRNHELKANWSQIAAYRWNQFLGTYQGYRQSGALSWDLRRTFYYPSLNHGETFPEKEREVAPIRYQDSSEQNAPGLQSAEEDES